jgi:hypothetical protein
MPKYGDRLLCETTCCCTRLSVFLTAASETRHARPFSPQVQTSEGAKLIAVSAKPSDGLILRTTDSASTFDDAQLARFQRFAPFIVEAELGRTAVTDACFDTLSKFANLRALHLESTAITGRSLAKLASLSQLTYLNLSGTKVTSDALAPLKGMPNLRHIYLFDTPAEPASSDTNSTLRSTQ